MAIVVPVGEDHSIERDSGSKDGRLTSYAYAGLARFLGSITLRIVAGVDCHKSSHTVVFLNAVGELCGQLTFSTSESGYQSALDLAVQLGCREWGLEGSGCYGYALAVFAAAEDALVFDVPGLLTQRHRKHSTHRGKSDVNDARAIAEVVLREPDRLATFSVAVTQRALRLRYDQRDRLVRERTKAANRLRGAALLIGISKLPADITATRTASEIAASVLALRSSATANIALAAVLDELDDACETIRLLNAKIRATEQHIRPLVRRVAPDLLAVHGISEVSAAGIIGHAGDISNCRNASAFASKCGVAPVDCSSGRSSTVRLNVGGDRQLNRLLHVAAMSQVRCASHAGRQYYDRKRTEGKTHLAAMRCLKRTLATVVFYRLRAVDALLSDENSAPVAA